ncbi:Stp1/IreP family PP2C-type Ser/Thr phosphatase [Pseudorhodoferax sp.]|uniref:Stp1/IreP family PP2C-type Ser/Thr phosphatase n=1 Tax=Pseudorhodoferax sp. TaxID=1993553 RepID=UPI0039E2467D
MSYEFAVQTHTGLLRSNNEDAAVFDAAYGLAVVADGMGGYNAGEVASGMAVGVVRAELGDWLAAAGPEATLRELRKAIDRCVQHANQAILDAARANPDYSGMGTTLILAVFQAQRVVVGHVGDSRGYRWRRHRLSRLTRDHSLLQEQLDAGLISPAQAAVSGRRNLVTRALGIDMVMQPDINEFPVEPGDLYLLCSDGLSDMIDDEQIGDLLGARDTLDSKARRLVACANSQGGRDNITVLLVQAGEAATPPRTSLMARLLRI